MILTRDNISSLNFESFIQSKILSERPETVLLIVPTNRKLRDLKKKIIGNFVNRPVTKINIETLTTLTTKMLKEYKSFTLLSEAASTVLIKETAEELELSYFAAYSKGIPFGTLDKIKNVISEYKKHGITPKLLIRETEKLTGGEKNKAFDIAAIYKLYLEKCQSLSALEIGDIYSALLELNEIQFSNYFNILFDQVETIILDGFDEFTNLEVDILKCLSSAVDSKLIINFDYYSKNEKLFAHLTDTYSYLSKNGFKKIIDKTPNEKSGFRSMIRAKLFNDNNHNPNNQLVSKLFKMTAKNRVKEVEFISQTIKLHLIEGKTRPENICVAFNLIGNYSSLVRDIFGKYGIPINLTDRIPIKTSQPVVAAINILELVENDFYFRDLVKVLTNGFLQFDDINVNNLIFIANELKITAGLQNWKTSIKDSLSILEFKEDLNDEERERIKRKLKKAETDITKLSKLLIPFRKKSTSKEFISNFKILLLKLKLPCKVIKDSNGKEEEFVKSLTVLLNTLNEVLTLINPNDDQETNSLEFYIEQLRTISNWARFNVKEKSDFGVLVTSINEIRGLSFDMLFLGGICDGDLPTRYSPEIFFSGTYQKKEQIHQTEERFHFYQALCTWNKNLYLTIPQKDSESELVESTFVKDIEKLFQFTNLEMMPETNIFSKEQLQIAISKNIHNEQLIKSADLSGIKIDDLIKRNDIRKKRKEIPYEEFVYSGFIGTDDEEIKKYLSIFIESEFSVSQLETFAKCPFKYFAERILKLIPLEEPAEEAQPIELGNVLHSILYDFYFKVVDEKIPIGKVGTKEFSRLKNLLFEIAEKKINNLNLNSPLAFFEKEKILGINSVKEHSILYNFLLTETNSESNLKPKYFEYSFGNFDKNSQENIPPYTIGELKLRGKIDRIDVDEENKLFNVIDYKLKGKKPTFPELNSGLSLQLPIYLMAGKHIITNLSEEDFSGNQMIIYSLDYKESNFGPLDIKLSKKRIINSEEITTLNEELLSNTKEKIIEYHNKLKKGHFHLSDLNEREEKVCKYCDFKSVCRVKEVFEF